MTTGPGRYEIRVQGHLDSHWAAWFPGMELAHLDDGTTALVGPVGDQAALHGLLGRVRDLGVPLVSVRAVPDPDHLAGDAPAAYRDGIPRGGTR